MSYDDLLKRVAPHSIEAEQACLGAMLFAPDLVPSFVELLNEEDFYDDRHKIIYRAIYELYDNHSVIDVITVIEKLQAMGKLDKAGGQEYIAKLLDLSFTTANTKAYANIIINRSILRNLINASKKIIDSIYQEDMDNIEKICDEAEKSIFDVTHRRLRTSYKLISEVLTETMAGIIKLQKHKHVYTGLPTGFIEFDNKTSGLQNGDLIVIAARPSMGKTALALCIGRNVAQDKDKAVLIFSLEMSYQELALRMISSESRVDMQKIRKGYITKEESTAIANAAGELSKLKILIDDTPAISLNEIRAKSRRVKKQYNLSLIIIDHLQLITSTDANKMVINRNVEISYISRSLKALAKELDIPIIVLSQLSREVEKRQDKRPILSDLRESGAIEQDADIVAFLYRESYYNKEAKDNKTELIIQKHRNGPTGTVNLAFLTDIVRFENLEEHRNYVPEAEEKEEEF